eukprot:11478-Heterococcus_DN1.PRE.1
MIHQVYPHDPVAHCAEHAGFDIRCYKVGGCIVASTEPCVFRASARPTSFKLYRLSSAMETEPDLTSYVDNSDDEAAPPLPPPPLPPLPPSPSNDLPVMSGVLADDGSAAAAAPAGRGRGRGRGEVVAAVPLLASQNWTSRWDFGHQQ